MKKIAILAMSFCFLLNNAFAQSKDRGQYFSKEAKEELKKFKKETVYPAKKAEHDQFLSKLSQEDRLFLEAKREEEKLLKEEMKAVRQEVYAQGKSGKSKEELKAEMKTAFAPMKEKYKAFTKSMKPFLERNELVVKTSLDALKVKQESWKIERKAIVEKYLTTEQKEKIQEYKEKSDKKDGKYSERKKGDSDKYKGMKAIRFVLWDGVFEEARRGKRNYHSCKKEGCTHGEGGQKSERKESVNSLGAVKSENTLNLSSYPNPAISQTTIIFDLPNQATKVALSLVDAQGKQVWKKTYNKLEAGANKLDMDLRNLPNGQYFYTLEIDGVQTTKSLVISK